MHYQLLARAEPGKGKGIPLNVVFKITQSLFDFAKAEQRDWIGA